MDVTNNRDCNLKEIYTLTKLGGYKTDYTVCKPDITFLLVVACQKYPVRPAELEAYSTSAGLIIA